MMTTIAAYAECNREPKFTYYISSSITSATYNASNDTITVNVNYENTNTTSSTSANCTPPGVGSANYYVSIGGVNSDTITMYNYGFGGNYNHRIPAGGLNFTVPAGGLNKASLAAGAYTITPYPIGQVSGSNTYIGIFSVAKTAPSSIITNLASYVRTDYENQNSYTCPADYPSGYYLQRRSYDVWSDGSIRNISAWANVESHCSAVFVRMGYDNGTQVCPSTQPNGVINIQQSYEVWSDGSIRNASGFKEISRTCAAIYVRTDYDNGTAACPATHPSGIITTKQSYDVWSDGSIRNVSGFKEVSRTCAAVYVRTDYDYGTQVCPAAQPSGIINTKQSYDVWSDGSIRNVSGFKETGRTCVAIKKETQTQTRDNTCPAGQTGKVTQTRTYDVWSDGSTKNYSAWTVSKNTCVANPLTPDTIKRVETCPEGYIGKKTYKWELYYTNDSYSVIDTDGTKIDYVLSTPHQREVLDTNTCTLVPSVDEIDKEKNVEGSELKSCDAYYNVSKGTYKGDAIYYGVYKTSYSSATKTTTRTFVQNGNIDLTSCVLNDELTFSYETKITPCASNEEGQKIDAVYYKLDNKGRKTVISSQAISNTCKAMQELGKDNEKAPIKLEGLLSNNSLTTSSLTNTTKFKDFISTIDKTTIKGDMYKLNLIVDDLNAKNYNVDNVSNTVAAFQKLNTGTTITSVKVFIPKSINQYVGRDSIASSNAKNKIIVSTELLSNGNLKVKYKDVVKGNKTAELKSFNVKMFNSNVDMSKISVQ